MRVDNKKVKLIKKIYYKKKLIAILIPLEVIKSTKKLNFITSVNNSLQIGIDKRESKSCVKSHIHKFCKKIILDSQEFIYIISGDIKVDLLNTQNRMIKTIILSSGDGILLISLAHRIYYLKETHAIYIKQGPCLNLAKSKLYLE